MNQTKTKQLALTAVVVIVIIALAVVAVANRNASSPAASSTVSTTSSTSDSATTTGNNQTYNDGNYTATGTYRSPGGSESIEVTVTLKDGNIVATSAVSKANESEGLEYQSQFIAGYKGLVVGKSIDSVSLSRVSGSSLTSQGFNNALTKIKAQAKS